MEATASPWSGRFETWFRMALRLGSHPSNPSGSHAEEQEIYSNREGPRLAHLNVLVSALCIQGQLCQFPGVPFSWANLLSGTISNSLRWKNGYAIHFLVDSRPPPPPPLRPLHASC